MGGVFFLPIQPNNSVFIRPLTDFFDKSSNIVEFSLVESFFPIIFVLFCCYSELVPCDDVERYCT